MLCKICTEILQCGQGNFEQVEGYTYYDDRPGFVCQHHTSVESLRSSINRCCQLCLTLWGEMEWAKATGVLLTATGTSMGLYHEKTSDHEAGLVFSIDIRIKTSHNMWKGRIQDETKS